MFNPTQRAAAEAQTKKGPGAGELSNLVDIYVTESLAMHLYFLKTMN